MLKVSNIAVSLDEKDYAKVIANTLNIRKGGADNFLDQKEQGEEKHGIYGTRKRTSSRPI